MKTGNVVTVVAVMVMVVMVVVLREVLSGYK
jgi:hypothetical protein